MPQYDSRPYDRLSICPLVHTSAVYKHAYTQIHPTEVRPATCANSLSHLHAKAGFMGQAESSDKLRNPLDSEGVEADLAIRPFILSSSAEPDESDDDETSSAWTQTQQDPQQLQHQQHGMYQCQPGQQHQQHGMYQCQPGQQHQQFQPSQLQQQWEEEEQEFLQRGQMHLQVAPPRQDGHLEHFAKWNEIRENKNDATMLVQVAILSNRTTWDQMANAMSLGVFSDPGTRPLAFAVGICFHGFYDDWHHKKPSRDRSRLKDYSRQLPLRAMGHCKAEILKDLAT